MSLANYSAVGPEVNPGMSVPSTTVTPTTPNGLSAEPGVQSMDWNGQGLLNAAAWANFAEAPREYGTSTNDVNETIQQQHVLFPWDDGCHTRINKYQPMFTARNLDKEHGMNNEITLAKLNEIIRQSYQTFNVLTEGDESMRNAEAVEFKKYLKYYGEDQLELYHQLVKGHMVGKQQWEEHASKQGLFKVEDDKGNVILNASSMASFYEMATKDVFRYMTKFGILQKW
jgi:hypothetical protein